MAAALSRKKASSKKGRKKAKYGNPQCPRGHHQKGTRFTTRQLAKQSRHLDQRSAFLRVLSFAVLPQAKTRRHMEAQKRCW